MKYIDAEKLYKKVDELMAHYAKSEEDMDEEGNTDWATYYQGQRTTCSKILTLINSLQQERSSEVDLEKEINSFFPESYFETAINFDDVADIARHFYELGFNARK